MYVITNRVVFEKREGLEAFGKDPNPSGPNELRLVKVSETGTFNTEVQKDRLKPAEVIELIKKHGLDIDPREHDVQYLRWDGPKDTPAEKVETFARMLEALGPGTWLFVDHPAYDVPEMRAVHHAGYEDVAVDRQGVVEAWTSPRAKDIVARRGIELIGYRDLAGE